jgi:predicted PurR-regulated permease PerM
LTVVITGVVLVPVLFSGIVGPLLTGQINDLIIQLPEAAERFRNQFLEQEWARRLFVEPGSVQDLMPSVKEVMGGVTSAFSRTLGVVANAFVILFIGIYGAAAPESYMSGVAHLTPQRHRERAHEVIDALAHALRWWLVGRLTMMTVVGVLTTLGLWVAGVPTPLALGLLAALLSFVPYVGPILSFIPAVLVALMVSLTKVVYVVIVFGIVQTLESYVITPLVQQRAVSLPPVILITAQIAMGVLAGATGVLLAAPLAIVIIVLLQMLYVEDVLGDSVRVLGQ